MAHTGRTHRLGFCLYQTNKTFCELTLLLRDTRCSLDKLLGNLFVCAWEISETVVQHGARPGTVVMTRAAAAAGAGPFVWFFFILEWWNNELGPWPGLSLRREVMPAVEDSLLAERGEALPVGGHQRGLRPAKIRGQIALPYQTNWWQDPIKMSGGREDVWRIDNNNSVSLKASKNTGVC